MPASFTTYLPALELEPVIARYYHIEGSEPSQDRIELVHAGMGWALAGDWEVSFDGRPYEPVPEAWACGPLDHEGMGRGTAGRMLGAILLPWGWAQLTGLPAHLYVNRFVPMAELFGGEAASLIGELRALPLPAALDRLDRFFLDLSSHREPPPPIVGRAYAALSSGEVTNVAGWADRIGLHMRQLERLCRRYFGLAPKRLLMRERVMRTVRAMREGEGEEDSWARLIDTSYADQAHFVREFRQFMNLPPAAWRDRPSAVERPEEPLPRPS